jgi:Mg2+ and Co2+ transporter CorA
LCISAARLPSQKKIPEKVSEEEEGGDTTEFSDSSDDEFEELKRKSKKTKLDPSKTKKLPVANKKSKLFEDDGNNLVNFTVWPCLEQYCCR